MAILPEPTKEQLEALGGLVLTKEGKPADISFISKPTAESVPLITSSQGEDLVLKAKETEEKLSATATLPKEEIKTPEIPETKPATISGALSEEEARKLFGSDFTGVIKQPDGTFVADASALERLQKQKVPLTPTVPTTPQDEELINLKKDLTSLKNQLTGFTISDAELGGQLDSITNAWNQRIAQMEDVNKRRIKATETVALRLGARFAGGKGGIFGGIIADEERQGVLRIGELEAKKQAALSEARAAARKQNWDVYVKQIDLAEEAVENKIKEMKDLSQLVIDKQKADATTIKAQNEAFGAALDSSEKLIKSLGYLALNSFIGDAEKDAETLKLLSIQYGVDPNKLLNETQRLETEKIKYPAGDIGNYLFYRDQALESGIDTKGILDFDSWLTREATRKARAAEPKPPTQAQSLAAGYAARLDQAEPTLTKLEKQIQGMSTISFEAQIFTDRPSLQSATVQAYLQATRNFINAQLRRESGAVISPSEFSEARKQYLPQPGDTDEALKLKRENRRVAFLALKGAAGKAYEEFEDLFEVPEETPEISDALQKLLEEEGL